jgi:glucoamylase
VRLVDQHSLSYQQVDTASSGRYRITKTYVADPATSTVLVDLSFESLTGAPYQVYAYLDPSLTNTGMDDSGTCGSARLLASDGATASALIASPGLAQTSCGFLGTSDGWTDLRDDHMMDWHFASAPSGNVVQTGRLKLDGTGASTSWPPASQRGPGSPRWPPPATTATCSPSRCGTTSHRRAATASPR